MGLRNRAFLEIDSENIISGNSKTAVFEFENGFEPRGEVKKNYLVGNFGQRIDEAIQFVTSPGDFAIDSDTTNRRVGYSLDLGAGTWGGSFEFEAGADAYAWGDQESDPGPENITTTDASGEGVPTIARKQIFENWIAKTRSDSFGYVRLHVGEYTDGEISGVSGVNAGAFGYPIPLQIREVTVTDPVDESYLEGTVQYFRTQLNPGVLGDLANWVQNNTDIGGETADPAEEVPDP